MASTDFALMGLLLGAFMLPVVSNRTPLLYFGSLKKLSSFIGITATSTALCAVIFGGFVAWEKAVRWFTRDGNPGDGNGAEGRDTDQRTRGMDEEVQGSDGVELQPMGASREL